MINKLFTNQSKLKTGMLVLMATAMVQSASTVTQAATISQLNFESGTIGSNNSTYNGWAVQANPGDLTIVTDPAGSTNKVMKASMNKSENFSSVANGSPRTELASKYLLNLNTEYNLQWKMFIPSDFQFDVTSNREIITQVHQTSLDGSPPIELGLKGNQYYYDSQFIGSEIPFADASADRGKWVNWRMHYKPSTSSSTAITEFYKDGQLVAKYSGQNAYNSQGYPKVGIYKWGWKTQTSNVTNRTIYYDDVTIIEGAVSTDPVPTPTPTPTPTPSIAAPSNLAVGGVYKGATSGNYYVRLYWKDNSNNETGFKIERSLNSTSNFQVIKTPTANSTRYDVNVGTTKGTYYFRITAVNGTTQSAYSNVVRKSIY